MECAKFSGLRAILGLVGLVLSCHCAFVSPKYFLVGILWVQIFLSLVLRGSKKMFFVGFSSVQTFFLWIFRRSKIFFSWVFRGPIFFLVANFVIQGFSVVGCMKKSDRKQKYINASQTRHSNPNCFQQLSVLFILER